MSLLKITTNASSARLPGALRTIAIAAWIIATIIAVVVVSCLELSAGRRFSDARAEATRERDLVISQEALRSRIHESESSALGYILTGDKAYRDAYGEDSAATLSLTADVTAKSAPAHRAHDDLLALRIRTCIEELDSLVALKAAGHSDIATGTVRARVGSSKLLARDIDADIDRELSVFRPLIRKATIAYQARIRYYFIDGVLLTSSMAIALWITWQQLRMRRRAEKMLREEAGKLQRLTEVIHATTDFVGLADARGKVLFHNRALRTLLGGSMDDDLVDTYLHETHTPESLEMMMNEAIPTATAEGIWHGEATYLSGEGVEVPVSKVLIAHKNPDSTISHFSTIARDIRQSKRDSAALIEKQRFVEQLAQASPNILYLFDLVTRRNLYCNSRIYDVLGYNPDDVQQIGSLFESIIHPDDVDYIMAAQQKLLKADDHGLISIEYRMRHADGEWRWMRSREMVFKRDDNDVPIQCIGVAEDVSDQKRVLDEMVVERHRLAAIIEAKRQIMQSTEDIESAMTLACEHAQAITFAESAAIMMPDGDDMVCHSVSGTGGPPPGMRIPTNESLGAICLATREPVICVDVQSDERVRSESIRGLGLRSLMLVPLFCDEESIGVICVGSTKINAFNSGDLHGLSMIADFIASTFVRVNESAEKQRLLDQRTQALQQVGENEDLMRSVFYAIQEGLTVMSADGTVELCNPAAARILDVTEEDIVGLRGPLPGCEWLNRDGSAFAIDEFPSRVALVTGMPISDVTIGLQRKEKDVIWLLVGAYPLIDKKGNTGTRVVTTFTDITSRINSERRLNELATTDGLTGIGNHRAFRDQLSIEMARSSRQGRPLALIMLDVDHFKSFNDMFGHPEGDVVLKQIATILKSAARGTDYTARYGGEEFAIILPDTDSDGAAIIALRLRLAVEEANWALRPITISVGVATFSPDLVDTSDFVARADRALYRAKSQGRNRVCVSRRGSHDPLAAPNRQAA